MTVKIIARCAVKNYDSINAKQKSDLTHIVPMSLHQNCILFCRILALQYN